MSKYDELLNEMESTIQTISPAERAKMADKAVLIARELKESNPELSAKFTQLAAKARRLGVKWEPPPPPGKSKQFAGG